jgi:hypothetical protein
MELIERASMTPERQVMYQMAQQFYEKTLANHESFTKWHPRAIWEGDSKENLSHSRSSE